MFPIKPDSGVNVCPVESISDDSVDRRGSVFRVFLQAHWNSTAEKLLKFRKMK